MDVLSSRVIIRSSDPGRSRRFYRDVLGLAVYREFGPRDDPGVVFFLGQGLLEVSGHAAGSGGEGGGGSTASGGRVQLWVQVRDLAAEHVRLSAAGVAVTRPPRLEPWGLHEMWIRDPDGVDVVLVEIPPDHPLRRDQR